MSAPKMSRSAENPIIAPTAQWWENAFVFNPAVVEWEGMVHMLYRAHGDDHFSRFGHAWSADGVRFERNPQPVLEADINDPMERLGIEDPRAVALDGWVYATFTVASVYGVCPPQERRVETEPPWRVRVSMARTRDFQKWERFGIVLPDIDSKNAVLFNRKINGRYVMLHRVIPNICIATSDDMRTWTNHGPIMGPRDENHWDFKRIGSGPPPMEVEKGWLLFFHGIDRHHTYRCGAALLDRDDPSKVLARLDDWMLEPQAEFEQQGWIGNVVFPTGCIERDGLYRLYYGGADKVICTCTIPRAEVEEALYAAM
jgi:beta-1,2-mannobiose phosphorylase / 1,2-beta-oligomannan phosphorylase